MAAVKTFLYLYAPKMFIMKNPNIFWNSGIYYLYFWLQAVSFVQATGCMHNEVLDYTEILPTTTSMLGFGSQFLLALTKRLVNATGTRNIFLSNRLSSSADTPYPGSPGLKKAFSYHFSSPHPPARGITSQIYHASCRLSWQFWLTWLFLTILTGNGVTVVRTYNKETFIMGNITFDIQGKL